MKSVLYTVALAGISRTCGMRQVTLSLERALPVPAYDDAKPGKVLQYVR